MRRSSRSIALACAAALSLALGGPGSALAGTPGSDGDAAVPARVEVPTCTRGPASADRTVVFRGETQPIAGSLRMAMRFTLLERVGSGPPMPRTDVRAMRSWRRSRAGVRRFGYSQRVAGLRPGADYSALVQFRWTDANGHLVRRARRVSVVCSQREPVVNLAVAPVSVEPGRTSGTAVYTLRVTNAGGIAARSVGAALDLRGARYERSIPFLDAGQTASLRVGAPACRGDLTALADPRGAIPESDETDNARTWPCPSGTSGRG